jgi:competence protein ComEC
MSKLNKKVIIVILGALIFGNILVWLAVFEVGQSQELKVVFFDIGQGNAVFVETPQKTQILIDGGPTPMILEKLAGELPFFDRQIDLVILTHPDFDHLAGLVEVLKSYQVDLVSWTGVESKTAEYQEFMVEASKTKKVVLSRGEKITVGKNLRFEVLAPLEDFKGREVKDYNTSSLVLKMTYGKSDFLLTGDAPISIERQLVNIASEILEVGHHGSSSSTSDTFLEKVRPEIAVIQVGKDNKYGHPNQVVLERLEKYGIKVMRTDELGDIKFFSDGSQLTIEPEE